MVIIVTLPGFRGLRDIPREVILSGPKELPNRMKRPKLVTLCTTTGSVDGTPDNSRQKMDMGKEASSSLFWHSSVCLRSSNCIALSEAS